MADARTGLDWLASLSPWPEEFGLGRMHALLAALGEPQRALRRDPRRRHERQDVDDAHVRRAAPGGRDCASAPTSRRTSAAGPSGSRSTARDADLERALARVRPHAAGATQFEVLTAAAFAEFAAREVDVAVVEAGLGGRHDATNVLDAPVVVLTNVALDHTDVLGETREDDRRREARGRRARRRRRARRARVGGGRRARPAPPASTCRRARTSRSPSRPPRPSSAGPSTRTPRRPSGSRAGSSAAREQPLEIWDGAHNLAGIGYLLAPAARAPTSRSSPRSSPTRTPTRCCARSRPSATRSSRRSSANARALPAAELADLAAPHFAAVEAVPDPARGARPRAGAGGTGRRRPRDRLALPACRAFVRCVEPVR